ncbi:hypothetical protein [Pseudomonas gingeri]|uniref:hypothetical protein n=1 Tax=Pseudomonas gingeri TaxID=117681 RepID=UPI0015A4A9CE|nr:hypothetical protein [Pseudomonas gingeri]NVZ99269.1 hypothetical protein [Pseudomonas gingeri]NWA13314.1 hypothetical protein [Pseudomonas gingeri]NWA55575.1 hypothetical protein [Pseudomonas gingeri]NWA95571.1 hypothetical protein [Pseudomonas gingeri]NWB00658.1 hypothetical protein [Pseudomonas gingeri]
MVAEARKKGLIYRLGYGVGWLSRRYFGYEKALLGCMTRKGMPAAFTGMLGWCVRLGIDRRLFVSGVLGGGYCDGAVFLDDNPGKQFEF